ncbi:MAG: MMPL family transporter, partial [Pseudomonadota bacterium]
MDTFADFILKKRLLIISLILAITGIFMFGIVTRLKVSTVFGNLLPQNHEYIKVHKEFERIFGGANLLIVMLKVKDGDIFNEKTLKKIQHITEGITQIPGVDRHKVLSIAAQKLKKSKITAWGLEFTSLMYPFVPKNAEELKKLKDSIYSNEQYYGLYVSYDSKKTLVFADFFEDEMNYEIVYDALTKIRNETEDENTEVCIVGNPMHLGVVSKMTTTMNYIMAATLMVIPVLLFWCYRTISGVVIVIAAPVIALIWGLGFMAFMGYNLDPLVFVIPFLIALMAFRHSHQFYNRFYEEYMMDRNVIKGCKTVLVEMFIPGLTSVATDALGIMIVGVVPIVLLQNISFGCAFSSVATILIGCILTPILISYTTPSPKFIEHIEREHRKDSNCQGWANHFAKWLGNYIIQRGKVTILIVTIVITAFSYYWAEKIIIGDAQVGSNLLRPSSRYNRDSVAINQNLP